MTAAVVIWTAADIEGVMCDGINTIVDQQGRTTDTFTRGSCGHGASSALAMFTVALLAAEGAATMYLLRSDLPAATAMEGPDSCLQAADCRIFFGCTAKPKSRPRIAGAARARK